MRISILSFVFMCILTSCTKQEEPPMVFPVETWVEVTPESQGFSSEKLEAAARYLEANAGSDGVKELVVIRNGQLVWKGDDPGRVHGIWSITKSFTTLCMGLLIDDGKVAYDSRAAEFLPRLEEHYPEVTLRHFAAMTSGYRAIGDEPRGTYLHGPSETPFAPNPEPLFSPPGSKYAYWDSAMNMFALVLTEAAGEPLEDLFRRRIADPIGMKGWIWGDFGEVDGLKVNGGSGNGNQHVQISALELARLGHLFLNRGYWSGRQLISAEFVDESVKSQVLASLPLGHEESGIDGRGTYGLNWWTNTPGADGTPKWPEAPPRTFSRSGYNNNDLFVIPEWNVVVVRLGLDEQERAINDEVYSRFVGMIGESLAGGVD